ncbi:MAG: hypothetical protein Q4B92_05750 [Ruminococcus sp.]|nr:hypothetical protein [Ruminococcus sp.]
MFNMLKNMSPKTNTVLKFIIISVLVVSLAVGSTYAWFITNLTTSVNNGDEYITVSADAGLKLSYGEEFETQGEIIIQRQAPDAVLSECSSVDGRNIFFPISDYSKIEHTDNNNEFVNDVKTEELIFREATANDKNKKYISFDFEISAASSTDIWLSNRSYITGTAADAIRISFDLHNGKAPIVIDNTPATYANTNYAVETINTSGQKLTTVEQKPLAIGDYVNNGNNKTPLFTLDAGEDMVVTMTIWLEGTDPECTEAVLSQDDLQINIEFSTVVEDLNSVTFIDYTLEQWADDDECKLFVQDVNNEDMIYNMHQEEEGSRIWTIDLPMDVEEINFIRRHPTSSSESDWNIWEAGTVGNCRTYNAFGHGSGIWYDGLTADTIYLFDGTPTGFLSDSGAKHSTYVNYTLTDGNGVSQTLNYFMSYYEEAVEFVDYLNCWAVNVPSVAGNITFNRCNPNDVSKVWNYWTANNRGSNLYYTAVSGADNASGGGYWTNKLLFLNQNGYKSNADLAVYYFGTNITGWAELSAKTANGNYVAPIHNNANGVQFCRVNTSATSFGFGNNVYNQTHDNHNSFGNKNLFTIKGYHEDNSYYMWGEWTTVANP